jgi:hypothetical protein
MTLDLTRTILSLRYGSQVAENPRSSEDERS